MASTKTPVDVPLLPPPINLHTLTEGLRYAQTHRFHHTTTTTTVHHSCWRAQQSCEAIPRVDANTLSYDEFLTKFVFQCRPVLLHSVAENWFATKHWRRSSCDSADGACSHWEIDWNSIETEFGDAVVPVVCCAVANAATSCDDDRSPVLGECKESSLKSYRNWWKTDQNNHAKFTFYLKDWHAVRHLRNSASQVHQSPQQTGETQQTGKTPIAFYAIPKLFSQDWLNLHFDRKSRRVPKLYKQVVSVVDVIPSSVWDDAKCQMRKKHDITTIVANLVEYIEKYAQENCTAEVTANPQVIDDDYRFVYIGPSGSTTPLHADVFRSFSWSTNICGVKRWKMYSADSEGECSQHQGTSDMPFTNVEQHAGETLFVPSDCFHSVENVTDCISINHNWINATNCLHVARHLRSELHQVKQSLEDLKETPDFAELCQVVMRANTGMNTQEFLCMLVEMCHDQLLLLEILANLEQPPDSKKQSTHGSRHDISVVLNLCLVLQVLSEWANEPAELLITLNQDFARVFAQAKHAVEVRMQMWDTGDKLWAQACALWAV